MRECEQRDIAMPNPDGLFIEAVAAGTQSMPWADIALRAHRLCDAVYRSAADGGVPVRP